MYFVCVYDYVRSSSLEVSGYTKVLGRHSHGLIEESSVHPASHHFQTCVERNVPGTGHFDRRQIHFLGHLKTYELTLTLPPLGKKVAYT